MTRIEGNAPPATSEIQENSLRQEPPHIQQQPGTLSQGQVSSLASDGSQVTGVMALTQRDITQTPTYGWPLGRFPHLIPPPDQGAARSTLASSNAKPEDVICPPYLRLENDRPITSDTRSAHVATLLKETLGSPSQEYVAHESLNLDRDQWLLDKKGRVFQISTQPQTGMVALHSSTPLLDSASTPSSIRAALLESGNPPAAKNYLAIATGVYQDNNGKHWRVHDGKPHTLTVIGLWQQAEPGVTELSGGADNGVYGLKDGNKVINLSNGEASVHLDQSISAYAVSQDGQVALLMKADNGNQPATLRLQPSLGAPPGQTLNLTPRYAANTQEQGAAPNAVPELTSLGFSGNALFAADKENRVLMAPQPRPGQSELLFSPMPQYELQNAFGKDMQAEGFTSDNSGRLSLLIKDNANQLHACPLNESGKTFRPGWNLSDILHIDNTLGLESLQVSGLPTQHFGISGSFAVADGKLHFKDQLTQQWRTAADQVESLQRGLDGQPYVLHEGRVKQLSVDHRSDTIGYGDNNIFALPQSRGKPNLGKSPAGMPKGNIKAAAILSTSEHIALTRENDGDILKYTHIRPLTGKPMHPAITISTNSIEGEIRHLAVDRDQTLYALSSEGKLFSLPGQQWKKPIVDRNIQWEELPLPFPGDQMVTGRLSLSEDFRLEISTSSGERAIRQADGWKTPQATANENQKSTRDMLFDNLAHASKKYKLGKNGIRYAVTAKLGGITGMETRKIGSKFWDRLRAHGIKFSWETPRPLKAAVYGIQHHWQGRKGLSKLYEQEHGLYKELESRNTLIKAGLSPERPAGLDIRARLERLDLGEAGQDLKAAIETFLGDLEKSAERRLMELGKHQGVLQANGEVNRNYKPSRLKNTVQSMNPNRTGHSLSQELLTQWKDAPASADSKVEKLLQDFTDLNVNMSHQKTEIPLGRRRDPNDRMALCKARLVLDTLALKRVDELLDKAEILAGRQLTEKQTSTLLKDLSQVRDVFYENSKVKYYTDKGMNSHQEAENCYDALKSFIKAFSKRDHGVNLITRAALKTKEQDQLNTELKKALNSLKVDDNITITRGYTGGAGLVFFPSIAKLAKFFIIIPNLGAEKKGSYEMELNGLGDGIECVVKRKRGAGGNLNVGLYRDILPDALKRERSDAPIPLNEDSSSKASLLAGAGVTGNGNYVSGHELAFKIQGEDINRFVDGLTDGTTTPEELMNMGKGHMTVQGKRYDFNVDLAINLTGRLQIDPNDKDENPLFIFRIIGGLNYGLNLLSTSKEDLKYRNVENFRNRINNRSGFFNNTSAGARFGLTFGINTKISGSPERNEGAQNDNSSGVSTQSDNRHGLAFFGNVESGASVVVDNSVLSRAQIKTQRVEPIDVVDMGKLCDRLAGAFHDPVSQQVIKGVKLLTDIGEQLQVLKTHFLTSGVVEPRNDTQYAVLRGIESTSTQHLASINNMEMMTDLKAVTAHFNPSRLNNPGMLEYLASLVAPSRKNSLTSKIKAMMKEDPAMARILTQISRVPNCYTWVTLELKDAPRRQIDERIAKGEATIEDAKRLIRTPENRRIRSIAILETGQHKEGLIFPTPVLGGSSNANIYMERFTGSINFKYGADQGIPRGYTLTGDIVSSGEDIIHAATELKKQGMDINPNNRKPGATN